MPAKILRGDRTLCLLVPGWEKTLNFLVLSNLSSSDTPTLEFWGAKVKAGKSLKVKPGENCLVHISQASLVKAENGASALLYATIDDKKLILGTLSQDITFDHLLFDRELDSGYVHFTGHKRNKKKKKRANESSRIPVSVKKSKPNTENSFEELTKICQNLVALLKSLPTKKDLPAIFDKWERTTESRWPLKRDSWRDKRPDNIPPQYVQSEGNCWAIAHYRQWSTRAKLKGSSRPKLTLDKLMSGVSFRYRSADGQLSKLDAAVEFMKNGNYVDEMFVHVKPSGDSEDDKFERLIEHLLIDGPVAVSFDYFPSYRTGEGRILSPTVTERLRNSYEHTGKHVGLLMGSGIEIVDGEPKHFWDIYESRGSAWRDCGFDKLARHEGLILEATEMRL